jgi:flagellar secretion chaperone FliS
MNATVAINAYKKIGVESKVIGADPHQLTSMLFHGALARIANAKSEMNRKDIAAKGQSISKAIAIIGEGLHASLDKKVGGELAQNLSALYDYMVRRLIEANLKNDAAILDEVSGLLGGLAEAWDSIRPKTVQPTSSINAGANAHLAYSRV